MSTAASLVVEFGESVQSGAVALIELDSERNVDADGKVKTSFYPGDEVYFLIHHDSNLVIKWVRPTSGTVNSIGSVTRERTERLTFTPENLEHEVKYNPAGAADAVWYGNEPDLQPFDGRVLAVPDTDPLPAVGDVSFDVDFHGYRFVPPALDLEEGESWPVIIVARIEAAE